MNNLAGSPGELRFTLTITRKDTGKVEHVDMVGRVIANPDEEQVSEKEADHGCDPLDGSA